MPNSFSIVMEVFLIIVITSSLAFMYMNNVFNYLFGGVANATNALGSWASGPFTYGTGNVTLMVTNVITGTNGKYLVYAFVMLAIVAVAIYFFAGEGSSEEGGTYVIYGE